MNTDTRQDTIPSVETFSGKGRKARAEGAAAEARAAGYHVEVYTFCTGIEVRAYTA